MNKLKMWLFLLMFVLLATPVCTAAVQLPQTGQATCYDITGAVIDCPGTGQDGDLQTGALWPETRFTIGTGEQADCITDNLTGLMWLRNPDGSQRRWTEALSYVANLNSTTQPCGYDDWRLPNIIEAESLIHAGESNQADWLNGNGFLNISDLISYWTSSTSLGSPSAAWIVSFHQGNTTIANKGVMGHATIPVRGTSSGTVQLWKTGQTTCFDAAGDPVPCQNSGQDGETLAGAVWPSQRFDAVGECVFDNLTGLLWVKTPSASQVNWQDALDRANALNLCNYSDWRLPNRKELFSLINFGTENPAEWLNGQGFSGVQTDLTDSDYWTSTTNADGHCNSWVLRMAQGSIGIRAKNDGRWFTWAVRSDILRLNVTPAAIEFGVVPVDATSASQEITIANTGTLDITVNQIAKTGNDPTMFEVVSGGANPCPNLPATISPGSSCTLSATFVPTSAGGKSAEVSIRSNDSYRPYQSVALTGVGIRIDTSGQEGTIGTIVQVTTDSSFGLKKGKVFLGSLKTKILEWYDNSIKYQVRKVPSPAEQAYDVSIYRKPYKTTLPITLTREFTVKLPEIYTLPVSSGSYKDEILVPGKFFSTKKGKVYLEASSGGVTISKKCPIKLWRMLPDTNEGEIIFVVPKNLTPGVYTLKIINKVGMDTTSFTIE